MLMLLAILVFASSAQAQRYEIHPYVGGQFLTDFQAEDDQIGRFDFRNPAVYGLKGGAFISDSFLIEGNLGYVNQLKPRSDFDPDISALQYEVLGSLNLFPWNWAGIYPYVSAGVGAVTINTSNELDMNGGDTSVFPVRVVPRPVGGGIFFRETVQLEMTDGDTFFNFSYGGGLKAQRLWGPVGLRADFRGRTMPNFYNSQLVNAFEMTGGLLFSWGER
jgi:hypothetical protein